MSYTIVEDGDTLQVRASIKGRDELLALIQKLVERGEDGTFENEETKTDE